MASALVKVDVVCAETFARTSRSSPTTHKGDVSFLRTKECLLSTTSSASSSGLRNPERGCSMAPSLLVARNARAPGGAVPAIEEIHPWRWAAHGSEEGASEHKAGLAAGTSITREDNSLAGANGAAYMPRSPRPLSINKLQSRVGTTQLRVAYQGVPGAYSEEAALKAYPDCEPVPCEQFDAAFQAVELWLVDRAVLPIENSLGGSIHRNFDLMLRHRLHIVGEVRLAVNHCLLALPGTKISDLKRVLSHPQALAQCEATLTPLGVTREAHSDTAGAAQYVAAEDLRDVGAVASRRAGEIYGLDILADGIQDDKDNVTRFMILAREPIIPSTDRPFKTSVVFCLEEGPGALFRALAVFALRDINLTKIESRPQSNVQLFWGKQPEKTANKTKSGQGFMYLFYVDFEASMADPRSQNALRHLQEFATFLRVLGSYPMDVTHTPRL